MSFFISVFQLLFPHPQCHLFKSCSISIWRTCAIFRMTSDTGDVREASCPNVRPEASSNACSDDAFIAMRHNASEEHPQPNDTSEKQEKDGGPHKRSKREILWLTGSNGFALFVLVSTSSVPFSWTYHLFEKRHNSWRLCCRPKPAIINYLY